MKKFNLTLVAGALALAVAGQANAAVTNTDLVLSVWDTATNTTYTYDTGISELAFGAGVTGTAAGISAASPLSIAGVTSVTTAAGTSYDLSSNATGLSSFLASISAADYTAGAVQWNVVASSATTSVKNFSLPTAASNQLYVTSNDPTLAAISNPVLLGTAAAINLNNSVMTSDSTSTGVLGGTISGNLPFNTAGVLSSDTSSSSLGFYFMTPTSKSATGTSVYAQFGNAVGADMFTLSSSGLTYTVAAAVPEPGEWLLMLSGLALVGFIATRRKNSSMTFA